MKPLGVRAKLFLTSLCLILIVGLASLVYLERGLRAWLTGRIEGELKRYATAACVMVEQAPSLTEADQLADRIGGATSVRVTIVDGAGTVLGDSELTPAEIAQTENHARRPEIVAAHEGQDGVAARYSTTLQDHLLYVATVFRRADGSGVVRVAKPLSEVDAVVARLRLFLLFSGLLGLVAALVMSGLATAWASRALWPLIDHARAVVSGERARRLTVASPDELGLLAGSFNRLAEDLDRAVSELAEERDRFVAILENMSEAVIALDESDRVELVNHAALQLLSTSEARLGQPVVELVRSPALADLLPRVRAEGHASVEFSLPGRPPRLLLARAAMLEATSGVVVVMHDLTEMRRLESVRRDFVANVSHELRTPISIIRANAETLLQGAMNDPEHGPKFASGIVRNAERLGSIVADLLDLSRIESGKQRFEPSDVALQQATLRVLDSLRTAAQTKGITLASRVETEIEVHVDDAALEQVLLNLLDNAIKYTPAGGTVEVVAREVGDRVQIDIRDDGPGIDRRHRTRVFERFYRVDAGRSRDMGGTGLGLAIVKHLSEGMGGGVELLENDPRGSIFRLTLPNRGSDAPG